MSWGRLKRVAAATASPLTLDEIKRHLRLDTSEEDALLQRLLETAVAGIEGPNGRGLALISQTWRLSAETFPCGEFIIPLWPVISVDSITYVDGTGVTQTLTGFQKDLEANPVRLRPAYGSPWPTARGDLAGVKISFTAGFGAAASDVPADLRHLLLLTVAHLFEHREATTAEALQLLPEGVRSIIDRYAVGTIV